MAPYVLNLSLSFLQARFVSDGLFRSENDVFEFNMMKDLLPGPKVVRERTQFQWFAKYEE